jgi:hypothetical protein
VIVAWSSGEPIVVVIARDRVGIGRALNGTELDDPLALAEPVVAPTGRPACDQVDDHRPGRLLEGNDHRCWV